MLEIIASPIVLRTTAPAHSNLNRVLDGPSLSARKNASFSLSFLVQAHQRGADLLFQVISQRYERGSIILTSNKAFKQWPAIFNGDSTITSAVLDRLLHHAETILIEGSSYRMKDRTET